VLVLILTRRHFGQRTDRVVLQPVLLAMLGALVGLSVAYVGIASIGPTFWLVVLGGLLLWWRRPPTPKTTYAQEARQLLVAEGDSSLSYMSTWPGNDYWFNDDRSVTLPYRVPATVALTTGDPFGAVDRRLDAVREFADFCGGNGWTPCFYSVAEPIRWRCRPSATRSAAPTSRT
jgi:lysylphosphatidylglycerol synthetase-like protein (DUF2156 family)